MVSKISIQNVNSIGHLIEGNIYTFLQQSVASSEMLNANIQFLDQLIKRISGHFHAPKNHWTTIEEGVMTLKERWNEIREEWNKLSKINNLESFLKNNKTLLDGLDHVSSLFSQFKVNSILLPGFDRDNPVNSLLTNEKTPEKILEPHPANTALILQFEESFNKEDRSLLHVFSNFEKALYHINDWPGVFLWNKDESIFLPIKDESELHEIFNVVRYEHDAFTFLRDRFERKHEQRQYAYLFHLSDFHFGNKLAQKRIKRVKTILKDQIDNLEGNSVLIPIITGDLMESPGKLNKKSYLKFSGRLKSMGFKKPVHVLGNHDVAKNGLFRFLGKKKSVLSSLTNTSKIKIYKELKLAIVKFDSNIGGKFAQGKIGKHQLAELDREIDEIEDKDSYTFIGMLHHHPLEFENPAWYEADWYESLLGTKYYETSMKLVDADLFLDWIHKRGIKYIFHGHKHIPTIQKHHDITIVGAGSTTGCVNHQDKGKTYLTYNLIKYDVEAKKPIFVSIIAEETIGAGTRNMLLHLV